MYYADVLIIQVCLPYALFFCFSANCYLDVLSSVSVAVFNWDIDSVISYQSDFFSALYMILMDVN